MITLDQLPGFFANLLTALKLKEHPDGFSVRNIPSYMLDQMFHVELGTISGGSASQMVHNFSVPVTLNVFFKEYRSPNQLRQAAFAKAFEILKLFLQIRVRTQSGLKDIRPTQISLVPLNQSNDKSAILTVGFEVLLSYVFQGEII